jgi:hypothetical protein
MPFVLVGVENSSSLRVKTANERTSCAVEKSLVASSKKKFDVFNVADSLVLPLPRANLAATSRLERSINRV